MDIIDAPVEFRHYSDATYDYYGEAGPGATAPALNAAVWRVSRITKATGDETWADSGNFSQVFTDLAAAQGLFA